MIKHLVKKCSCGNIIKIKQVDGIIKEIEGGRPARIFGDRLGNVMINSEKTVKCRSAEEFCHRYMLVRGFKEI